MKQILVTCDPDERLLRLPIDELNVLQGDLKEMSLEDYEKFRALVLRDGVNFALHVWKELLTVKSKSEAKRVACQAGGQDDGNRVFKWWLIDGTGRKRMLTKMRDMDGFTVPPLPCVEIFAASLDEAKLQILSASSAFHKMTHQGLYEFSQGLSLPAVKLLDYSLPHVRLPKYMQEFHDEPDTSPGTEKDQGKLDEKHRIYITCPTCGDRFERGQAKAED